MRITLIWSLILTATVWASTPAFAGTEVIVCNRADGTFSVVDADHDTVMATYALPADDNPTQTMYAVYVEPVDLLFIGDRGNDRVVAYSPSDYSTPVAEIPAGAGVFHMWADALGHQLWVNNDIDKTTTVIDPSTLSVIGTAQTPDDLVNDGGKPHDVVVDWYGDYAYVSVVGVPGDDWIVQYDTSTLSEVNRVQANGDDVHLSYNFWREQIYAPTQGANEVTTFAVPSLVKRDSIPVPNAHGADTFKAGLDLFLTTNIADGGVAGIQLIDPRRNELLDAADTPFPTPHNVVAVQAQGGRKIYVTHSGALSQEVSVFFLRGKSLRFKGSLVTGTNPFGIAHIPSRP